VARQATKGLLLRLRQYRRPRSGLRVVAPRQPHNQAKHNPIKYDAARLCLLSHQHRVYASDFNLLGERLREASCARPLRLADGTSDLAAALNRVAGIAAVATGCPAANCDAARAACGATASRVGARASVFHIQQDAGTVGDAPQLRGGRLADPGEEHTSWARVISSPEGRRRRSRSPAAAARSASGRHRRAWPQRDPAAPAGGGRLQFGSIVAHRFDTNGWNRRVSPVAPRPCEGPLTEPTAGAQPWPRERVLMPLKRPSRSARELA
jgi:hypothetical protein